MKTLDGIKGFLGKDWQETVGLMRSSLGSDIELLNATNEAILAHGGKQLRPIVSLLTARACGGGTANEDSIRYAAASELLHNATLLHDDVADNSSQRRGAPTVMAVLGDLRRFFSGISGSSRRWTTSWPPPLTATRS